MKYICSTSLCFALLLSQPALAQEASNPVSLDLTLDGRYDSNVLNISDARADVLQVKRSDWVVSPGLQLSVNKPVGRHSVQASAYAGYDFYTSNSKLNKERLSLQAASTLDLATCELSPNVRFSRARSEFSNYIIVNDPVADLDNVQTQQHYGANVSCGGILGLRPEAGVSYTKADNSSLRRQFSDFETVDGRLGLGYRHPSIGNFSVFYSKAKTTYDNRIVDGRKERYEVDRIGLSAQRDIGARLAWDGQVYHVTTSTGAAKGFKGLGYQLGVTLRATPQLRARASIGRDVNSSINSDALYTVDNSYGLNLDYAVNQALSLKAGYNQSDKDFTYSSFFGQLPVEIIREEKIQVVDLGATYRRSNRLAFTLYGGYEKRSADRDLFNYDGYFVGLRANIGLLR